MTSPILWLLWLPTIIGVGLVFPFLVLAAGAVAVGETVQERHQAREALRRQGQPSPDEGGEAPAGSQVRRAA